MAFIQSCFIRKNTPELRNKLEKLGYRYCTTFNKKAPYLWLGEGVIYDTFNINILTIEVGEYFSPYGISCGTNKELFLALAALRDDTDKNQWVIDEANECFGWENSCSICDKDNMNERVVYTHYRKATVKEIIEHFKNR